MYPTVLGPQVDLALEPRRSHLNASGRRRSHVGYTVTLCHFRHFDICLLTPLATRRYTRFILAGNIIIMSETFADLIARLRVGEIKKRLLLNTAPRSEHTAGCASVWRYSSADFISPPALDPFRCSSVDNGSGADCITW